MTVDSNESSDQQPEASPPPKRRRRRWWLWLGGALVLLVVGTLWLGPIAARPMVRRKLQALVSSQLNAELRMGKLSYSFPYGVQVDDAALVAKDTDGQPVELLSIPHLELGLAKLPFGDGPLVISRLTLEGPAIHMIKTTDGFVGVRQLVKKKEEQPGPKRSDLFLLQLVEVVAGEVRYEDRTLSDTVPAVWRRINLKLTTNPSENPWYNFDLVLSSGTLANAKIQGRFQIDDLDANLSKMAMRLTVGEDGAESPAPPVVQELLKRYEVKGQLAVDGTAHVRPQSLGRSTVDVTVKLDGGHVRFDNSLPPMDAASGQLRVTTEATTDAQRAWLKQRGSDAGALFMLIESMSAKMGGSAYAIEGGELRTDLKAKQWELDGLKGSGRLQGWAGGDVAVTLAGSGAIAKKPQGAVQVHATSPKLLLFHGKLALEQASLSLIARPDRLDIVDDGNQRHGLTAMLYGGPLHGTGNVQFGHSIAYDLSAKVTDADLASAMKQLAAGGGPKLDLSGRTQATLALKGDGPADVDALVNGLGGSGTMEVTDGKLYDVKSMALIMSALSLSKDAEVVNQAAAVFTIGGRKVTFSRVAASSPAIGVQGSGTIDFDAKVDFRLIVALLSDWKRKLKRTGIPIISDLLGEAAGGVQGLLNTVTKNLLYQFHVTGTLGNPVVATEPAPALTESAAKVFNQMMKGGGKLIDVIK